MREMAERGSSAEVEYAYQYSKRNNTIKLQDFAVSRLIQPRIAHCARLPAPVHPYPLIWIAANKILNNLSEPLRVSNDVGLVIARSDQLNNRIKSKARLLQLGIPYCESGDNRRIRAQRDPCQPTRRARRNTEEIHEHALLRCHIRVHKNSDRLTRLHR